MENSPAPQIVKIDIEGAELEALQKAQQLLSTSRPTIIVEVAERNADQVSEILRKADYYLFDAKKEQVLNKKNPCTRAGYNTLAIPIEKLHD